MTASERPSRLRLPLCADVSWAAGALPHGTAHRWDTCLALEATPAEWDSFRDLEQMSPTQLGGLQRLGEWSAGSGLGYGVVMFAPASPQNFQPHKRQIRLYTRPTGALSQYRVHQAFGSADDAWQALADTILQGQLPAGFQLQPEGAGNDWHICTHGRVDSACGKYGAALWQALKHQHDAGGPQRVWRTSHFGGHRFAATLLELPAGRSWAYLTPELAHALLHRTGDGTELAPYYRGWSALPASAQRADAAAFARWGWRWLDAPRRARVVHDSPEGFEVRLKVMPPQTASSKAAPLGAGEQITAYGKLSRTLELPDSSHSPELYPAPEYEVRLEGQFDDVVMAPKCNAKGGGDV